ncbi:3-hydroxydecanoyl-[ACP] dehydratase [hydrothermal vent metagenome]|uniref:3-hydroxydecanoyl-[ACP] dehydratase n=1 Tax=hydrothermal vent metagenome TaxID=652676 RepID=A0A1W1C9V7_9ZZZZ
MQELSLPHIAPIRFADKILFKEETTARVSLTFDSLPNLGMMIEAAAQSSAAFSDGTKKGGFLVSLKNIKLLQKPTKLELEVSLSNEHTLQDMSYFSFLIYEGSVELVSGSFVIVKNT